MHFRQRVAWLLLAIYLLLTAGVLYYMFEISTQLRMFALDHVDRAHTVPSSPLRPHEQQQYKKKLIVETAPASIVATCITFLWSAFGHVVDIPLPVLAVLILFIYIQVCSVQFRNSVSSSLIIITNNYNNYYDGCADA